MYTKKRTGWYADLIIGWRMMIGGNRARLIKTAEDLIRAGKRRLRLAKLSNS